MKKIVLAGLLLFTATLQSQEIPERIRNWSMGPHLGASTFLDGVNGYAFYPAISFGGRFTYDLAKYFALGWQFNVNFVHFSKDEDIDQGTVDLSSLTHLLVAEFKPVGGLFFGPVFGFSQITYNFRKDGGLSHRDAKGGDDLLVFGGVAGWHFKLGKVFSMGPRIDYYHYSATHTDFVNSHDSIGIYYTTKWSF